MRRGGVDGDRKTGGGFDRRLGIGDGGLCSVRAIFYRRWEVMSVTCAIRVMS